MPAAKFDADPCEKASKLMAVIALTVIHKPDTRLIEPPVKPVKQRTDLFFDELKASAMSTIVTSGIVFEFEPDDGDHCIAVCPVTPVGEIEPETPFIEWKM